jgi:4-hydroxy-tetrahydrodipicolinate synthase
MEALSGVAVTPTTPFDRDGDSVLYDELRRNTEFLVDAGIPTIIPCGNTGEYYSLSGEERLRIVEETVDAVGGDAAVVAGAGGSTKEVLSLADRYASFGVDGVMLMHPGHTYVHEEGLLEYYQKIAAATDLGLILYKRGPELTDELLARLSELENVVAVKYAVNDVCGFSNVVETATGDVVWSVGLAERYVPAFAVEGAEGFTSGIGNFVPEVPLALMDALQEGDWERAKRVRKLARPMETLRESAGSNNRFANANNVPTVKYGMELADLYGGPVREPLTDLTEEDRRRVEEYYGEIKERMSDLSG